MGAIKDTTDATFEADVLQNDKPVLVDFWAPWCGPCRAVAPVLEELAVAHADKIDIVKLNTDENLARQLALRHHRHPDAQRLRQVARSSRPSSAPCRSPSSSASSPTTSTDGRRVSRPDPTGPAGTRFPASIAPGGCVLAEDGTVAPPAERPLGAVRLDQPPADLESVTAPPGLRVHTRTTGHPGPTPSHRLHAGPGSASADHP